MLNLIGGIKKKMLCLLYLHRVKFKKENRYLIVMEGEIIGFYCYGMDFALKGINMIVYLLGFGQKGYRIILGSWFIQDLLLMLIVHSK